MIACLGNGERAQGQQKPSSGDLEGFSLAGSAEERHEGGLVKFEVVGWEIL